MMQARRHGARTLLVALLGMAVGAWGRAQGPSPVAFDLSAPKLVGEKADWLNTEGKTLTFEKGKVYVVEFWTFG